MKTRKLSISSQRCAPADAYDSEISSCYPMQPNFFHQRRTSEGIKLSPGIETLAPQSQQKGFYGAFIKQIKRHQRKVFVVRNGKTRIELPRPKYDEFKADKSLSMTESLPRFIKSKREFTSIKSKQINLDLPWSDLIPSQQVQDRKEITPNSYRPEHKGSYYDKELNQSVKKLLVQIEALKEYKLSNRSHSGTKNTPVTCHEVLGDKGKLIFSRSLSPEQKTDRIEKEMELSVTKRVLYKTAYFVLKGKNRKLEWIQLKPKEQNFHLQAKLQVSQRIDKFKAALKKRDLSEPRSLQKGFIQIHLVNAPMKPVFERHTNSNLPSITKQLQIQSNPYENLCVKASGMQSLRKII